MIVVSAILIPGSGHVFLKKPVRGLFYLFWIYAMSYIGFKLSAEELPIFVSFSGGLIIWMSSVLEVGLCIRSGKMSSRKE